MEKCKGQQMIIKLINARHGISDLRYFGSPRVLLSSCEENGDFYSHTEEKYQYNHCKMSVCATCQWSEAMLVEYSRGCTDVRDTQV